MLADVGQRWAKPCRIEPELDLVWPDFGQICRSTELGSNSVQTWPKPHCSFGRVWPSAGQHRPTLVEFGPTLAVGATVEQLLRRLWSSQISTSSPGVTSRSRRQCNFLGVALCRNRPSRAADFEKQKRPPWPAWSSEGRLSSRGQAWDLGAGVHTCGPRCWRGRWRWRSEAGLGPGRFFLRSLPAAAKERRS